MVIMDRQDYINKTNSLLNQNTYRSIPRGAINTIKNKLISILKRVKNQTGLDSNTYKSMYPTGHVPPKFYGLPKIHKLDTPLRPIVSSCGSVTYGVAKELAKILKPFVGKSPHHTNSTQDFVEQVKHITLAPGECLSSYDVSALFTSVPVDPALNIIKDLLKKDHTLKERTVLAVSDIILLLEFCLKNTYFSFQDQFYEQVEDSAMASPVSPIVANLYMEYLEQKALSTVPTPQVLDDTFVIHKEVNKQGFLQHKSVDPAIKFTVEFSVINTLSHRATTVCSKPELLQQKKDHLRKALTKCKYPKWALDKVEKRLIRSTSEVNDGVNNQGTTAAQPITNEVKNKGHIVIPYTQGLVKASKRSVVDMPFKLTSKVAGPSRASWSPPRTKTLWSTKVVPSIGTNVVT